MTWLEWQLHGHLSLHLICFIMYSGLLCVCVFFVLFWTYQIYPRLRIFAWMFSLHGKPFPQRLFVSCYSDLSLNDISFLVKFKNKTAIESFSIQLPHHCLSLFIYLFLYLLWIYEPPTQHWTKTDALSVCLEQCLVHSRCWVNEWMNEWNYSWQPSPQQGSVPMFCIIIALWVFTSWHFSQILINKS